jgi:hypothetical protein
MTRNRERSRAPEGYAVCRAADWSQLAALVSRAKQELSPRKGEDLWFRGTSDSNYKLAPTLMRDTTGLSTDRHDGIEQNLFFEFQARSSELRSRNLNDWEYLFHSRHHGIPTRLIDWTDTLGVAIYFALEEHQHSTTGGSGGLAVKPAIWVLNPYSLNEKTWDNRDIILPRYLGLDDDKEYWDFGELLVGDGKWAWDGPVAVYPIQLGERVRAQRGWFTIHGNNRKPLEEQFPRLLWKIVLEPKCVVDGLQFLEWAGFNKFSIYPDLDSLATLLRQKNLELAKNFVTSGPNRNRKSSKTKNGKATKRKKSR